MAIYKLKELREKTDEELKRILEDLRKELITLRMKIKYNMQLENPKRHKEIRKTIARILTILRERSAK